MRFSTTASSKFGAASKIILDGLFPPQCPCCQDSVSQAGTLCANCWGNITFISHPTCFGCGYPFEYDVDEMALCGSCIQNRPSFDRAISVFQYDEHSKDMILAFKHGDQTDQTISFATWMVRAGQEILSPDSIVIPVPLHPKRLLMRRYNQAALLAREIARQSNLKFDLSNLRRTRSTASQGNKSAKARHTNVKGAFKLTTEGQNKLSGHDVILVDDVYTTGATLEECSKTLLKAGVRSVSALTLGRVVRANGG